VGLIGATLDRSINDVLNSLERAEAAGLIGPGARPGCFAFVHDVFRSVRYASLTTSRRLLLHAAVAHTLSDRAGHDKASPELARHACLAGPRFEPTVAAELARRAGDAAADATDHSEATAHYRRALDALDLVPGADDRARLELSIRLGASLVLLGDADGGTTLRTAALAARRRGDPVAVSKAVCAMAPMPGGSTSAGPAINTSGSWPNLPSRPSHQPKWRGAFACRRSWACNCGSPMPRNGARR
jgi:hypothetical protein